MLIKVCIDAGHGGKDPGAVKGKRYEKDDTLRFAKRLGKVLKANGVEVIYTRTTDIFESPSEKAKKGNNTKADFFVSMHRNASSKASAHGTEVLVYSQNGIKNEIAKNICEGFKKVGFTDRGVKVQPTLAVLRETNMQAILVEVGFISNQGDNELLDKKFYSAVNVVAREICKAYDIDFKTITELKK